VAIRLSCNINNTSELTLEILKGIIKEDDRVSFLAPAGMGEVILTRIRTHISRRRSHMKRTGKKMKYFPTQVHGASRNPQRHPVRLRGVLQARQRDVRDE
jgi:hypothetical protein